MPRLFSGRALRTARQNADASLTDLAVATGRSAFTIQAYELGRAVPTANVLPALADAVGVTVDELFIGEAVLADAA